MSKIKELFDKKQQNFVAMRDLGKAVENGAYTPEQTARFNELDAEMTSIDSQIAILQRSAQLETERVAREGNEQRAAAEPEKRFNDKATFTEQRGIYTIGVTKGIEKLDSEERAIWNHVDRQNKVFGKWFRGQGLTDEERTVLASMEERAQSTTTTAGGYTIPQGFSYEVDKQLQTISQLRQWARIFPTDTGNDIPWPTNNDTTNTGELLSENSDASASSADLVFGQTTLKAEKFSTKMIKSSNELLRDSAVNLPAFIAEAFAERIAKVTNTYFTTGTGTSQPLGYTDATLGFQQGAGSTVANSFGADDIIDLMHSVDQAYRDMPSAAFAMHDLMIAQIKKMSNSSTDDRPLWLPSIREGAPETLYGKPYFINNAMASAVADQAKVIYFGDWSRFVIRVVNGYTVRRLSERYAEFDQTAWVGFTRQDSRVLNRTAVKYLKCT